LANHARSEFPYLPACRLPARLVAAWRLCPGRPGGSARRFSIRQHGLVQRYSARWQTGVCP
jgi:hypothetical protein